MKKGTQIVRLLSLAVLALVAVVGGGAQAAPPQAERDASALLMLQRQVLRR